MPKSEGLTTTGKLIAAHVPAETYEKVRKYAESHDLPVAWVVRRAVAEFIEKVSD